MRGVANSRGPKARRGLAVAVASAGCGAAAAGKEWVRDGGNRVRVLEGFTIYILVWFIWIGLNLWAILGQNVLEIGLV